MKSGIPARKSRSPPGRDATHNEEEVGDELDEDREHKQVPNTMVVNKKVPRLARADLSNTAAFFGRKARSNSPKESGPVKLNTHIRQQIYGKCHSPAAPRSPIPGTARHKEEDLLALDEPNPTANLVVKYGMISKASKSPPRTATARTKPSPERVDAVPLRNKGGSPVPTTRFQPFEPEDCKALRTVARKKRLLNEELWDAASSGDVVKLARLLEPVRKGDLTADINSTGIENRTALHCAVYENKLEAAKLLLKHGAAPDARTVHHRTPLHIACILGEDLMCKLLLASGATVCLQDFEKNTPVHYAAFYKNIKILKLVLEKKPNLTIKNKKGQTAIDITNSKTIISLFWHYLTGNPEAGSAEDAKAEAPKTQPHPAGLPLPKAAPLLPVKKTAAKVVLGRKPAKTKEYTGSENLTSADSSGSSGMPKKGRREDLAGGDSKKWSSGNVSISSTGGEPEKVGLSTFSPVQLLGKGSFGEVYLVKKKATGQHYAMKVLSKHMIMGQNLTKYAYTEKNVQSVIRHPFIVKLHCSFQTQTRLFLILDYCPGGDLGHVLQREKKLSVDLSRLYLAEVLLAIQELHNREIIYRDLKPDNVVLDGEGHAVLTDFGLSKEGVKETDFTQSFCGSVAYLAPEMLRRSGHGRTVDWYLLGVLLYEMLVGIPPYFNRNKEKLFDNIKRGPLQVPADMPSDALDLIVKLLNRDPKQRLGAGAGDAEEIKAHPFFKTINWEEAMERKLKMPKPHLRPIVETGVSFDLFRDAEPNEDESKLNRWTFVSNDFK